MLFTLPWISCGGKKQTHMLCWIITDAGGDVCFFFFLWGWGGGTVCMWGVYKLEAHGGSLTPYNWDCNTIWPKAGHDTGNNSKSWPPVCQYFSCSHHHITVNFKWNWKTAYLKRPTWCSQQDPQFGIKTDFFHIMWGFSTVGGQLKDMGGNNLSMQGRFRFSGRCTGYS